MNKKITLSLGSIALVAAPLAAVISCGSSKGSSGAQTTGGQTTTGPPTIGSIKTGPFSKLTFDVFNKSTWINIYNRPAVSAAAKALIKSIHDSRNAAAVEWHDTGDVLIDTINDFRFIVVSAAKGDHAALNLLKKFSETTTEGQATVKGSVQDALVSYQAFLSGNITQVIPAGAMGHTNGITISELQKITPARADYKLMAEAQYRTLSMAFIGRTDGHQASQTTAQVTAANGQSTHIKGLQAWPSAGAGGENLTTPITYGSEDGKMDYYEAFLMNLGYFADTNNGMPTHVVGHRVNMLLGGTHVGWSFDIMHDTFVQVYHFGGTTTGTLNLNRIKGTDPNNPAITYSVASVTNQDSTLKAKVSAAKTLQEVLNILNNAGYIANWHIISDGVYDRINIGEMPTPGGSSLSKVMSPYDILGTGNLVTETFK